MDKSSNDIADHIVESARVARELQSLRQQMTPQELERADLMLAKAMEHAAAVIAKRQKGK